MTAAVEEKRPVAPPPLPGETTSTTVAVRPDRAPALYVQDDDAEGEFTNDDVDKAYLTIVAKTGELSNLFPPGSMLLNKEYVVGGTQEPIELIAVAIKKGYQNDLDFDGGEIGDTVSKALEVVDRGGEVGYRPFEDKDATHFWKPILQVIFLVKRPATLTPEASVLFPFTIGANDYGVVGYTARTKTAYNGIAKTLIGAKRAKGTVRGSTYRLSTKGETWEKRSWIQPSLRVIGSVSEDVTKFITENYSG